ncbi:MAG: O-antigen ligase family protein [Desulfonatronovibrio sp.]
MNRNLILNSLEFLHGLLSKIFPPCPGLVRAPNMYVETLGLLGLFLYLASFNLHDDLFGAAEIIIVFSFFMSWRSWSCLYAKPLFWMACLWLFAVAASAIAGIHNFPQIPVLEQLDESRRMLLYSLFIVIGWWTGPNPIAIRNAFLIACLGFVASSVSWLLDWDLLLAMLEGDRPGRKILGLWTNQYACWAGYLLLGVAFLGRNLIPDWLKTGRKIYPAYFLLFGIVVCLTLAVYITQTRTIWFSVIISLVLGTLLAVYGCRKTWLSMRTLATPLLIFFMIILISVFYFDALKDRFAQESATIKKVLSGDAEQVELTSLGIRIHAYQWALELDSFVSVFGWGPLATSTVSENEELRIKHEWPQGFTMVHLHNNILEILFRAGIVGLTAILSIILLFFINIIYLYRHEHMPSCFPVFMITTLFYFVFSGMTTYNMRIDALFPILGGLIFSATLITGGDNQESEQLSE